MKKYILISFLGLFISSSFAQSPIITSDNVYLIGDQTQIAWCSNPTEPGAEGADVTWDFSGLTEIEERVFNYVDPSETLFSYQFPDATLCGVGMDNYHSFYSVSNNYLIVEGYAGYEEGSNDTLKILYSDVEELIPLPFEFGDTHFDTFEGSSEAMGFVIDIEGEIDLEVDGYGTLILPNGTYENAIRYHFNRTQDNNFFGQTTTVTKEQWGWMSSDHRFWLCLMETNNNGFGEEDIVWFSKNPLVLSNKVEEVESIKIYPNPVENNQTLFFQSDVEGASLIQIIALDGRVIQSANQFLVVGENKLNPNRLAAGIYTIRILTKNRRLVSKLVVQ